MLIPKTQKGTPEEEGSTNGGKAHQQSTTVKTSTPKLDPNTGFFTTEPCGNVCDIKATNVSMLSFPKADGTRNIPEVGDYVLVVSGNYGHYSQIADIELDLSSKTDVTESDIAKCKAMVSIRLLVTVDLKTKKIYTGLHGSPSLGDKVYPAHANLTQAVCLSSSGGSEDTVDVAIQYAKLPGPEGLELSFPPERLFGRHLCIVGATGGGKSWSVARLVDECAKFNSKVILFDATGEYWTLNRAVQHVHFGSDEGANLASIGISLPYYELSEGDLFAVFRPQGESQAPKLRAAMKSLKVAKNAHHLAPGGTILKAHRPKTDYLQAYSEFLEDVESSDATFDIRFLTAQIQNECVHPQSSPVEPLIWGGPNGVDQALCTPLISRIGDIISNPTLSSIFAPKGEPSLFEEIRKFLNDISKHVFVISMRNLSFAYSVREIVVNAIGRRLLDFGRKGHFRTKPLLVILDEAHQFLNTNTNDETSDFPLNSFALISKEGRKFALNICLATQRPRDIPEGVLSQMGTMIVHRLTNDRDLDVIERASGNSSAASLSIIPSLIPGQALMMGVDFPVPLKVDVMEPSTKPESKGANYQHYWRGSTSRSKG